MKEPTITEFIDAYVKACLPRTTPIQEILYESMKKLTKKEIYESFQSYYKRNRCRCILIPKESDNDYNGVKVRFNS